MRYDRSVIREGTRFWNVMPKAKSQKKIRPKFDSKLRLIGHFTAERVAMELNPIIRGWMNYYEIKGVSYTQVPFRKLNDYLRNRLGRYYHRKSQRRSRLYGQEAYELLTKQYGLVVPYVSSGLRPVNAKR